ncbi:RTA1 like protein-domain-containing protein [Bisporella sp. PMI_857]|nr:RTA1 like protein-domain-containing protein [Bisporella sp. PMI_857]
MKQRHTEFVGFIAKLPLYEYEPSIVAAIIFIAFFAISTALRLWQMIRSRAWFLVPFVIGGFFEIIGYAGRMISSKEAPDYSKGPFIIQALLLLLASAFFAASIYMVLGRIILLIDGEKHSQIRQRWLAKIFVTGDVVGNKSKSDLGQKVFIIGLFIQIICFGIFIFTSFLLHRRIGKSPTPLSDLPSIPWRKHMWALYAANALIMLRSIFRVVEYIQGREGYLQSKEVFLYIFDAVLMFAVMTILNVVHPSQIGDLLKELGRGNWKLEDLLSEGWRESTRVGGE